MLIIEFSPARSGRRKKLSVKKWQPMLRSDKTIYGFLTEKKQELMHLLVSELNQSRFNPARRKNNFQRLWRPIISFARIGFTAIFLLFPCVNAIAADAQVWHMREVRRQPDAKLDYCVLEQALVAGPELSLAADPLGRLNLGLVVSENLLPRVTGGKTQTVKLSIQFDEGKAETLTAHRQWGGVLLMDLPQPELFREKFAAARSLMIAIQAQRLVFPLSPSEQPLEQLADCLEGSGRSLGSETLALLKVGGLDQDLSEIPPPSGLGFVDYAWQRANLVGGSKDFKPEPDFTRAIRAQLAEIKAFCRGLWSEQAGLMRGRAGMLSQEFILTCISDGTEEVMGIVFHQSAAGNTRFYVHGSTGEHRAEVESATKKLTQALYQ
jgi:hypothetical protein